MRACSVMSDSFVTPWTIFHQCLLLMEFPSQQYLSGLPFPPPRNLQNSGIKPASSVSPALALGGFFTTAAPGKPQHVIHL